MTGFRGARGVGRVAVGVIVAAVVVAGGVAAVAGGGEVGVVARYPGRGAQRVSPSAEISVQLRVGWMDAQETFDMVVTGPGGRIVPGHSGLDKTQALSFTPVRPFAAGKYTAVVHLR